MCPLVRLIRRSPSPTATTARKDVGAVTSSPHELKSAPLLDHLEELRKRIIISAVFLAVAMAVGAL